MFRGGKKEVVYLPKDNIDSACEMIEKVIHEEAKLQNIDLTALDSNIDILGTRKNLFYSRFVRARNFRLDECKDMIMNTLKWRLTTKPASVSVEDVMELLKRDYCFFHREDKESNPVVWVNVQYHVDFADKQQVFQKFVLFMMEEGARRVNKILDELEKENSTSNEPKPLPSIKACLVFDMRGFGMGNMDFPLVKFLADTLQTHYPEVLAHTYVVDSPWIFSTCWTMIKGWLDPVVVSKIEFINRERLINYIDAENVPVLNGGTGVHEKMWETKEDINTEKANEEKKEDINVEKVNEAEIIYTEVYEEKIEIREEKEEIYVEKEEKIEIRKYEEEEINVEKVNEEEINT